MKINKILLKKLMTIITFVLVGIIVFSCTNSQGEIGSWPMWRYDAHHSGAMPKDLPSDLHLQWKWEFHSPEPAFPSEVVRLNFDSSY
jgi:hypothetical protein